MNEGSFSALWTKYLPVIRILLKRSINEPQQVSLGKMELQSVDNRKNANYSFNLEISKGKLENSIGGTVIGKDLYYLLSKDPVVSDFLTDKNVVIQMTRAAQLTLRSEPVLKADPV
jgi:hypothetical protein